MSRTKPSINYNTDITTHKLFVNLLNMTFFLGQWEQDAWKPCVFHIKHIEFHILFHLMSCMFPCVHSPLLHEIDYSGGNQSSFNNTYPDIGLTLALPLMTADNMEISCEPCLCYSHPDLVKLLPGTYPARRYYRVYEINRNSRLF